MTLTRKTPMKRSAISASSEVSLRAKVKRPMKSKQRAVSAAEKAFWSRLSSEIGCIACRIDGRENHYVSIHHVDGRTKPDCHKKVLPLCAQHHQQDDTDPLGRVAVHPNKAEFEIAYGSQERLIEMCLEIMDGA